MSTIPIKQTTVYTSSGKQLSFSSNDLDIISGVFEKHGYNKGTSNNIAVMLLTESRNINVNPLELVEGLNKLNNEQLTTVVAQLLNSKNSGNTIVGYRIQKDSNLVASRNVKV
jgi:hypothetical protein